MKRWILIACFGLSSALSVGLMGCKASESETNTDPAEESAASQESAASSAEPEAPKRTMEEAVEIMTKAIEGSREGEVGDTNCERAYGGMSKLNELLAEALGAKDVPEIPREGFLEICGELDEGVQRCMIPSYAMENREECREMRDALTPEIQERLRGLMRAPR